MDEWGAFLGRQYTELGSFRAIYTAISPTAEEPLRGIIAEDRETGACLVKLQADSGKGGAMWRLPRKAGENGGTFAKFGDSVFKVRGLVEMAQCFGELTSREEKETPQTHKPNLPLSPSIELGEETISVFLHTTTPGSSPAFADIPTSRVEEVRKTKESIELVLDDGSWIRLDRETGLLAGRGYPNDQGKRALTLETVQPLQGEDELLREIPEIDPAKLQEASAEVLRVADPLHSALFHHFVNRAHAEKAPTPEDLLSVNHSKLTGYWRAAWGHQAPPGFPANVVQSLQDLKGQKQAFLKDWNTTREVRPEALKEISFSQYFRLRRMKMREDLSAKIKVESAQRPDLARLRLLLDGEISKLPASHVAKGRVLANLLVERQRVAMVIALIPDIPEEVLESL